MTIKYEAVKCRCISPNCPDWHVSYIADVQGVHFTEAEARFVAEALNKRNEEIEVVEAVSKFKRTIDDAREKAER